MGFLTHRGTVLDGVLATPSLIARLDIDSAGQLVLTDNGAGHHVEFGLTIGMLAQMVAHIVYPPSLPNTVQIVLGGEMVRLGQDDIALVATSPDPASIPLYANRSGLQIDRLSAIAVDLAGQTVIYLAPASGSGIAGFQLHPNGSLTPVTTLADGPSIYAGGIAAMARVTLAGETYIVAASATQNGLGSFQVAADGSLTPVQSLGAAELLPIATPQMLQAVQFGGTTFVIAASAGSSSLTVLQMGADGQMVAVDQVTDTLITRFAGADLIESFTYGGRVFVLAAGRDDGLSLFTLLPDGRLILLETLADTAQVGLAHITDIATRTVGAEVQIFTLSGTDAGMEQYTFTPGALGVVQSATGPSLAGTAQNDMLAARSAGSDLDGGAGDDILIDGAGIDRLTGGAGADLFVLSPDGQADTITDFERGRDRLDLSSYPMLYGLSGITVTPTASGAILWVRGEQIILNSADGGTIYASMLRDSDIVNVSRVSLDTSGSLPPPVIEGDAANDHVVGGAGVQALFGWGGDDLLTGGAGADTLDGGAGIDLADYSTALAGVVVSLSQPASNTGDAAGDSFAGIEGLSGSPFDDMLTGDAGGNILRGQAGDDLLIGLEGDDTLWGGTGRDRLEGGMGNDTLDGGDGNDQILGHDGDDILWGGAGNDNISSSDGNDIVHGGIGHDQIGGGNGDDRLYGDAGNDTIGGGPGNDFIDAGDGNDVTSGGYGADLQYGGLGDDTMAGSYGNDVIWGGPGNDNLGGGTGKDQIHGEDGDDAIGGGSFDDMAWGGAGNDFVAGGDGNDQLWGESGDDILNGGFGDDILSGGTGSDLFVFNDLMSGEVDQITDFEPGVDLLRLRAVAGGFGGLSITAHAASGGTVITYGGHMIVLAGIDITQVDTGDFVFI